MAGCGSQGRFAGAVHGVALHRSVRKYEIADSAGLCLATAPAGRSELTRATEKWGLFFSLFPAVTVSSGSFAFLCSPVFTTASLSPSNLRFDR